MNTRIELHDSTLRAIENNASDVMLLLKPAIVHHSEGRPGIDDGTCWLQTIKILLKNAAIKGRPAVPNKISDGNVTVDGTQFDQVLTLSLSVSGHIRVDIITVDNERILIEAKHMEIQEADNPVYLEDFHGIS